MERFLQTPNLPEGRVTFGIIDGRVRTSILSTLEEYGVRVILTDKCSELYEAVSYHPDMFIHHLGGNNIVAAPNSPETTIQQLINEGFNIFRGEKAISRKYPDDVAYNVARIGTFAVCNISSTDKVLLSCLSDLGVKLIDVKQGYAKCSICIVDQNSLITSDEGIFKTLLKYDFDILKVTPGFISLSGLNYGFIGGASGFISNEYLGFTGNILLHPDFDKIQKFLDDHGKKVKVLDYDHLMDVGTFIPLKEYCTEELC